MDVLRRRAAEQADQPAYVFLAAGDTETARWSYAELDRRARAVAGWLQQQGARPGDRAVLVYPPSLQYISAFFGCLYAGVIAVPAYPPHPNRPPTRLQGMVRDASPAWILAAAPCPAAHEPSLNEPSRTWFDTSQLALDHAEAWQPPALDGNSLAFLQYTSGSTASPKGVMVSHGNLLHNERMIQAAFEHTEQSTFVGWLPMFHDMGLIGNVLQPLFIGALAVLMPPMCFLQRPFLWLQAISRFQGRTSGAPNFAYDLCAEKITAEERSTLALSCWDVAFCGAEPVRAATLDRFANAFAPHGFRRASLYPCYGLAEATLFVTGCQKGDPPLVRRFRVDKLEQHLAAPATNGEPARACVSCGRAWLSEEIAIVDPARSIRCGDRHVGEIWVRGPHVAHGYWRRAEETSQTFSATLDSCGPFLRTGDLGFLQDGELFITGRLKDLIVIRGRNHYPHDIELTVQTCHSLCRAGGTAAFAIDDGQEEYFVLVQEVTRHYRRGNLNEMVGCIRQAVADDHDVQIRAVVLIKPGSLPKTSSGKVQRQLCRNRYLDGTLDIVFTSDFTDPDAARTPDRPVDSLDAEIRQAIADKAPHAAVRLAETMKQLLARELRVPTAQIDSSLPISSLGCDSLHAVQLQHRLQSALGWQGSIADVLRARSLDQLARELVAQRFRSTPTCSSPGAKSEYGLSVGQQALWLLQQTVPENSDYNIALAVRIHSPVAPEHIERALQYLTERHPSLRARITERDGRAVQSTANPAVIQVQVHPADTWSERQLPEQLRAIRRRPLDLASSPFRTDLFLGRGSEQVLLLTAHHSLADLWSLAVFMDELGQVLAAIRGGEAPPLLPANSCYSEFVDWQQQWLDSADCAEHAEYWQQQLAGEIPPLQLPFAKALPQPQRESASHAFAVPARLHDQLCQLARREQTTLYTVLLSAFQVLLWRYTGQRVILVGSPVSGRSRAAFEDVVGHFVNMVVMRGDLDGELPFTVFLARMRDTVLDAVARQDFPFPLLVRQLRADGSPGRSPVFNISFAFERPHRHPELAPLIVGADGYCMTWSGRHVSSIAWDSQPCPFDMTLMMVETSEGLAARLLYQRGLYREQDVVRMARHYLRLLDQLVAEPTVRLSELSRVTGTEQRPRLFDGRDTYRDYSQLPSVLQRIDIQSGETPDAVAVVSGGHHVTYRGLNLRASQLAEELRSCGLEPDNRVGIHIERSVELVMSMLAVWKAGAAYVPLPVELPAGRLAKLVLDADMKLVLTSDTDLPSALWPTEGFHGNGQPCGTPRPDRPFVWQVPTGRPWLSEHSPANPCERALPDHLAYVIYTSGTTGDPKGVAVSHRSLHNHMWWLLERFPMDGSDRVLQRTSCGFDAAVWEFYAPLMCGGTLVMLHSNECRDLTRMIGVMRREQVTVLQLTPSVLAQLLAMDELPTVRTLRRLFSGGEALDAELARRLAASHSATICNLYGPTETTVDATAWEFAGACDTRSLPIGRPVANYGVSLLHPPLTPVARGAIGELHISGVGLARGYLGRPGWTAERFLPDPFAVSSGRRMYRTGDLARFDGNDSLEFLGRVDGQVKLRGHRIELGEIESALRQQPGVDDAAVVLRTDQAGHAHLVAHLIGEGERRLPDSCLRTSLAQTLPDYMVPEQYLWQATFPLTASGKLDRKALPGRGRCDGAGGREPRPRSVTEELLAGIWSQLLAIDEVAPGDDFFQLGGHSLLATQLFARIRETFQVEVPWSELFRGSTLRELARYIEAQRIDRSSPAVPPLRSVDRGEPLPLSFAQERLWYQHALDGGGPRYNMPAAVQLTGPIDVAALEASIAGLWERHEILRTVYPDTDGVPHQVVLTAPAPGLPTIDLSKLPSGREAVLKRLMRSHAHQNIDLARGPALRWTLVKMGAHQHVLLLVLHHIVCDGWSLSVLARELSDLYDARLRRQAPTLLPLPVQYGDFAVWQRQYLQGEAMQRLLDYWMRQLQGIAASGRLPIDHPRPGHGQVHSARVTSLLPCELARKLTDFHRREGVTLFMTLLAAMQVLLHWRTGCDDIAVGTDIANRNQRETESLIGFFINLLVLRTQFVGHPTLREFLARVRETVLAAYTHQDLPFAKLVERLQPRREWGQTPLFQVLFVLQNTPPMRLDLNGLQGSVIESGTNLSKFDLAVFVDLQEHGLAMTWEFPADVFDRSTIEGLSRQYQVLIEQLVEAPETRVHAPHLRERCDAALDPNGPKVIRETPMSELRPGRRRSVDLSAVEIVQTTRLRADRSLPLVVEPNLADVDLADWARGHREWINERLSQHGALLFRGFGIGTAAAFEQVALAVTPDLFRDYGDLPQEQGSDRVYHSTPYPPDQCIEFHNESSHLHRWPLRQWFYCVQAATTGGETPLVDCRDVLRRLDPAVREKFRELGLMYVRRFANHLDVDWETFFRTSDRQVVEEKCRADGIDVEWDSDDVLRTRKVCPAVVTHPRTGEEVFFNQIQVHHISCLAEEHRASLEALFAPEDLPRQVTYGDGSRIEDKVVRGLRALYRELAVDVPWRTGDIVLLDNMLVAHGRNAFSGPRKILVALGEMIGQDDLPGWQAYERSHA